jgi:hypothetical protein
LTDEQRLIVITGPNMGGKSTYMRQTALIAILAHIGSFVPADSLRIGPLDRIFTRIGASDDIAGGRSTFMVEMTETATILNNATAQSLVLMDEIGRGTSTFDGLSLAWAAAHYMGEEARAFTLFATHYFELTALADWCFCMRSSPGPPTKAMVFRSRRSRECPDTWCGVPATISQRWNPTSSRSRKARRRNCPWAQQPTTRMTSFVMHWTNWIRTR